jgi:hypothetical protein
MDNKTNAAETAERPGMIDVKEAVRKVAAYFLKLYPKLGAGANVMLEEVEQSEDGSYWHVTMGYDVERRVSGPPGLQHMFGPEPERHYKIFRVDARTGRIISMKIRPVK